MIAPSLPSEAPGDFPSRRWATLRRDARRLPRLAVGGGGGPPRLDRPRPVRRRCRPALYPDRRPRPGAGARRLQDRRAQRRGRDPRNARRRAAELSPQSRAAGPGAGVEAGLVTRLGRDAGRHRSPISCPPFLGNFGDHVVIARYPLQQPLAPAVRHITGQLADFCGTPPPIGG